MIAFAKDGFDQESERSSQVVLVTGVGVCDNRADVRSPE